VSCMAGVKFCCRGKPGREGRENLASAVPTGLGFNSGLPTIRMAIRRFTLLMNAFSRKLDNHKAACALHFAYYNFCRLHKSLRVTPAMEAGITDHIWSLAELMA
jgi:hypothetical protein